MTVDGVLLAGGPGSRLGCPKALARLHGRTLAEWGVATLATRCARVVVVTRPGIVLPPLDAEVVLDRPGPDAPLVGLATGLAALRAERVLVLGCDLPFAGPLLDRLLTAPGEAAVVGADDDNRAQPLCGRYPRMVTLAAADALLAQDRLPLMGLLRAISAHRVPALGDELLNINTPADLARADALPADPADAGRPGPGPGAG